MLPQPPWSLHSRPSRTSACSRDCSSEADPAELSERTLIPINRILEWIDQAMLIARVKRNVVAMRSSGVRTATDLARLYARAQSHNALVRID